MTAVDTEDDTKWKSGVLSALSGIGKKESVKVKKLRKLVLLSLQMDEDDKVAKKEFKRVVKALEDDGELKIDAEGLVKLKKSSGKKRKSKGETLAECTKKQKHSDNNNDKSDETQPGQASEQEEASPEEKNKPCQGNPSGATRLFLGNLPFAVDEASLEAFLPAHVTHIKWITDKETGKFYGSAFIEMDTSISAAKAVAMAGSQLMGRPLKVNFAPSRPGDIWPPVKKVISGGSTGQAGGSGIKAMSEKPETCTKLFAGNCSYEIDDDAITKFFGNVESEVKAVRWLHHKDSGDFKGCGYVEFWNTEACEKAATLNGKTLLGRPIRLDWAE